MTMPRDRDDPGTLAWWVLGGAVVYGLAAGLVEMLVEWLGGP